jgi:hypothetical protein
MTVALLLPQQSQKPTRSTNELVLGHRGGPEVNRASLAQHVVEKLFTGHVMADVALGNFQSYGAQRLVNLHSREFTGPHNLHSETRSNK